MARVKIGFNRVPVPKQIERSRLITGKMTGNPAFASPKPTLTAVKNATNALEKVYNESRGGSLTKMAIVRLRRKEMVELINLLAAYVQNASDGDAEIILSSGFDLVGERKEKSDTAGRATNLRLSNKPGSRSIRADWNAATDAVIYRVEVATDSEFTNIVQKKYTTKLHKVIHGLTEGTNYYVRVIAIGHENEGAPSAFSQRYAR